MDPDRLEGIEQIITEAQIAKVISSPLTVDQVRVMIDIPLK
jgi:hypothetical protein